MAAGSGMGRQQDGEANASNGGWLYGAGSKPAMMQIRSDVTSMFFSLLCRGNVCVMSELCEHNFRSSNPLGVHSKEPLYFVCHFRVLNTGYVGYLRIIDTFEN